MDIEQILAFTDELVFQKSGGHLSDLQQAMLRESWSWQRQSYEKIADAYGYSPTYLKHDVGPKLWKLLSQVLGEKVNKTSFRAAIERQFQLHQAATPATVPTHEPPAVEPEPVASSTDAGSDRTNTSVQDWGDAIDTRFFYGRETELAQLEQWIVSDRCRLITLLGLGGMGKTSLSIKLAQQIQSQFEWVIWRSLCNATPLSDLLTDLLQLLSNQREDNQTTRVNQRIARLLNCMRSQRCLLVLDNIETILQGAETSPNSSGTYDEGYEDYGEFFRQVGATMHQSCLVLTSREKPPEVALLEGELFPVRSFQLSGLQPPEVQQLFHLKGSFQGTEQEWRRLIDGYSGSPLALKIIATTIQTLFGGNIAEFLGQNTLVFGSIRRLIEQQFERLSPTEKTVMYWLAIYREPTTFADLRSDIVPTISPQALIEVLESLEHRSLIEKVKQTAESPTSITTASVPNSLGKSQAVQFSLQPVVMEYVTDRLVVQVCQELLDGLIISAKLLIKQHALLKVQMKDYVRDAQIRLILQPILERLESNLASRVALATHLIGCLSHLQNQSFAEVGYAGGNILNLLCQRYTRLQDYDFSKLVIRQAYLQHVELRNINFTDSDLAQCVFANRLGIVFTVAFSPDGATLVTGDAEGGLRLWQVSDGNLLINYEGHCGWVWSVDFSSNGQLLASCSSDKTIRLWEVATGRCLQILQGHTRALWSVAFSPSGDLLASGGDEPNIKVWDVKTGECIQELVGHTGHILTIAFSPDGEILASGSDDGTIRIWQVKMCTCLQQYQEHRDRVWSVRFNADSSLLVSGSADGTVKFWQLDAGDCIQTIPQEGRVRSIALSADGQRLVSSSDDQTMRVWEVSTGTCLQTLWGHTGAVFSVTLHPDGQTLASGSTDQTVKLWNLQTGRCLKTLRGYTNSVFSVAFHPQGHLLASSSTDQLVRLWETETGTCLNTLVGHTGWVTSVAFHPQGHLLASSSADQTVKLWDVQTGQCLRSLSGHAHWVQSVTFSPDGALLASSGDDRTIRLWSVNTGQCQQVWHGHTGWVWAIAFSPQGDLLASSSEDQTIRLWSVQQGQCVKVLQGHTTRIQSIAFHPQGELLASASGDETVRLWSVKTGECIRILTGHHNTVWTVAFSPDGETLASGSLDQTILLWEVNTGNCLGSMPLLMHSVRTAIAFQPSDPTVLASGGPNGTVQLWQLETRQNVKTLVPDRPYTGTNITRITGITEAQKLTLIALGAIEN
jgi:WD40 repeat protein